MRHPIPLHGMKFPLTLGDGLRGTFDDVVSIPLPRRLAALMRRLQADRNELSGEEPGHGASATRRPAVLIVEDDAEVRQVTVALLEDGQVDTIECESAEGALAVMLTGRREVGMIFADVRLPGAMDGIDLAWEVKLRWPHLPIILTSGQPPDRGSDMPPGVTYMPKPWQPLDVLVAAVDRIASAH